MSRKLASIQVVAKVEPIVNADSIERITVLGWELVAKKGDFKEGQMCVYCEIDSVLPELPEFEFLRKTKFRIRTIRLRGQISQGIAFPMDKLALPVRTYEIGEDVTEILGVKKWEPIIPAHLQSEIKGAFPSFIPKTDETRVQVLEPVLKRFAGTMCYATEKIDGSSVTYYLKDGEFGVCSRNLELKEKEGNSQWKFARENKIEEKLRELGRNLALQGEVFGAGIQGNPYKIKDVQVRFFNVFDIDEYAYLKWGSAVTLLDQLGLPLVPTKFDVLELPDNAKDCVDLAIFKSAINPEVWAEGIVIRPHEEIVDLEMARNFGNGRLSFKAVNPEFLIAGGE